jgi:YD repeat-containing protein
MRTIRRRGTAAHDFVTLLENAPHGELFRTTLPDGNVIAQSYDAVGRLVAIERKPDAATPGEKVALTLDAAGIRTREERQRWDGTQWVVDGFESYVYGTRCRLDKIVHADGSVTELGYDCNGNLSTIWDANHRRASSPPSQWLVYDFLNRVTRATQPWSGAGGGSAVTVYGYDVQDHLSSVVDAEGNETRYTVSDRDLVTLEESEVAGTRSYRHDEHRELVEETDGRGITALRTVDAADRVRLVDYPGTATDTRFEFDTAGIAFSKGRLTRIERGGIAIDYRYDRFGRVTQDGQLGYSSTKNGNTREITYPGGGKATYRFDFADRETELTYEAPGQAAVTIASGAKYLAAGPLAEVNLGNGVT